jgi:autotransporter-associated beta strand protein
VPQLRGNAVILLIGILLLTVSGNPSLAALSFAPGISTGTVQNISINEASGIAASRANANVLWTHNDSGDSARVFAMNSAGTNLGTYSISGAGAFDWEDIAIGPGPLAGQHYLYIADIGDNGALRSSVSVYRVPEPMVSDTQSPVSTSLSGAVKFTFQYPDGARDAESMLVDPVTRDIYIISKRENPKHLYRAAYPQSSSGPTTLQLMTTFLTDSTWLTAADISPSANEIIVRSTDTTSGRLYQRPAGGSIADAFATAPITIPLLSEPQGEAIAFDPNGWGYYTTSEGSQEPIYYFNRLPAPAGTMYWDNDGSAAGSYVATGTGLGGSGTWNTSSRKWYTGGTEVAWVGGNDAVFSGTAGTVTLAAGQSVHSLTFKTSGYLLTASTITLVGSSITVDSGVEASIGSAVAGSAGFAKNGNGTLTLTHANTYTGGTAINGGALVVTNTTGSGTGTGPVTVNVGAMLGGTGTIVGDVSNSGTLAPGMSAGTLHINGEYNQTADGRLEIELVSSSSFDALAITGTASLAGTLAVSLTGGFQPQGGDTFAFITASGFSDTTFGSTILPMLAGDLAWNVDYGANSVSLLVTLVGDFTGNGTVDGADYVVWRKGLGTTFTQTDYDVWRAHFGQSITPGVSSGAAVPEPAAWTLLGFAFVPIALARRRFRECCFRTR